MENMNKNKGQVLLLGAVIIAVIIIGIGVLLNSVHVVDRVSYKDSSINEEKFASFEKTFTKGGNIAASGSSGGTPSDAVSHYEDYITNLENNYNVEGAEFIVNNVTADGVWGVGQNSDQDFTNNTGSNEWTPAEGVSTYHKSLLEVSSRSGEFNVRGYSENTVPSDTSSYDWKLVLNSGSVTFETSTNSSSCNVSEPYNIRILENSVDCDGSESVDTFPSVYSNTSSLLFTNSSSVSGEYDIRVDSSASVGDSCGGSPCEDNGIYVIGVVDDGVVDVRYLSSDFSSDVKINNTAVKRFISMENQNIER